VTVDWDSLARAVAARDLADWVLTSRRHRALTARLAAAATRWRSDRGERLRVLVRRDLPSGRGTGVLELEPQRGAASAIVASAIAQAEAAVGPAWTTPPAAAPAKVALLEDELGSSLERAGERAEAALRAAAAAAEVELLDAELRLCREDVALRSRQGFEVGWAQSSYLVTATLARGDRVATLRRHARRLVELELSSAVAQLAERLAASAGAAEPPRQPVLLELDADVMLGDDGVGLWQVIAQLGDASARRRGLGRGSARVKLAPSSEAPLAVWSDGALPYGARSAPVGEEGEAIRRFPLLSDGALGDVGLGPRDAALIGSSPNGGVRNLVVNPGAGLVTAPAQRVIEIAQLRWLELDPLRGTAEGELALGFDRETGRTFRGGGFALDLVVALGAAQRSPNQVRRGAYLGPAWIRLGPLRLG
jgi:predicted Zn-dependent protease